jgi:hypothetical protein
MRPLSEISADILKDWSTTKIIRPALPYVNAMRRMGKIDDTIGADSARVVVMYFLSNAQTWRGEKAREIKKELNLMIK